MCLQSSIYIVCVYNLHESHTEHHNKTNLSVDPAEQSLAMTSQRFGVLGGTCLIAKLRKANCL